MNAKDAAARGAGDFAPIGATAPEFPAASPCDGSGMVLRREVTIRNARGLHARAAAKLVTMAERYSACLHVLRDGQKVPAASIMGLMMLGAGPGTTITIEAEGWDAKEAIEAVVGLVEARFNED